MRRRRRRAAPMRPPDLRPFHGPLGPRAGSRHPWRTANGGDEGVDEGEGVDEALRHGVYPRILHQGMRDDRGWNLGMHHDCVRLEWNVEGKITRNL